MIKISIIIPVYNASLYIKRCLDSIINQNYKNLEIICINDGSKDNSLKILNEYAAKDNRIVTINQENHRVSYSRNLGIDRATGDYILFLDSDDWLENNTFEILNQNTSPDIDILFFGNNNIKNDCVYSQNIYKFATTEYYFNNNIKESFSKLKTRTVWGKLYKLQRIQDLNIKFPRDMYYGEDTFFVIQNIINDCKVKTIENCLYNYTIDNNTSLTKINLKKQLDQLLILINHFDILFEKQSINRILKLYIYDNSYNIMSSFWNLYLTKDKEYYIKVLKQAFNFYSEYSADELVNLKGYRRIKLHLLMNKYHLSVFYWCFICHFALYYVILPYRRIKFLLRRKLSGK